MTTSETVPKRVLELSLRRTGSTTIHRALISHPQIHGPSEPFSFHTRSKGAGVFDRTDPLSPISFAGVNDYDPVFLNKFMEQHPTETWFLRHVLSFFEAKSTLLPKVRLSKETFISMHLGLTLKLLPKDLRVVYVTRDLRGIAGSYKTNDLIKKWKIPALFTQLKQTVMSHRELRERYADLFAVDENNTTWMELLMRKIIMFQSELNRHLLKKDNVKILEFEKFLIDARREMIDVLGWIGVDIDERVLDQAESFIQVHMDETPGLLHPLYQHRSPYDWTTSLTDQEIDTIETVCDHFNIPLKSVDRLEQRKITEAYRQTKPRMVISRTNDSSESQKKIPLPDRTTVVNELVKQLKPVQGEKDTYYLSKYEISNEFFASFLQWLDRQKITHDNIRYLIYNPTRGKIKRGDNGEWQVKEKYLHHPAVSITWLGAYLFSIWSGHRLPSLNEWTMGFKHGGTRYQDDMSNCNQRYIENTTTVGFLKPNTIDLFDMLGNVKEWTDTFVSPESVATPGGSWEDTPLMLDNHLNNTSIANLTEKDLGFRVASDNPTPRIITDDQLTKQIIEITRMLASKEVLVTSLENTYENIRKLFIN